MACIFCELEFHNGDMLPAIREWVAEGKVRSGRVKDPLVFCSLGKVKVGGWGEESDWQSVGWGGVGPFVC